MKKLNMKKAIERYNSIMDCICCEYFQIGTDFSESNTKNWNLKDMIAECDYQLSTYYEKDHCNYNFKFEGKTQYKEWLSQTGKLKRFINAYEPFVTDMTCNCSHCSRFD